MTAILVTRFKMGQIDVEDLEEMAADASRGGDVLGGEEGAGGDRGSAGFSAPGGGPPDASSSASKTLMERFQGLTGLSYRQLKAIG